MIKVGQEIRTPRFCTVKIEKVFDNVADMFNAGYVDDSYYLEDDWVIFGKPTDCYHRTFAAAKA